MINIFVSTHPFGVYDKAPRKALEKTGWNIFYNPYQRKLKPSELAELAKDCDGLIAGTEDLTLLVQTNPKLRFISRVGIGLDSVPIPLCIEKGIRVSYTPDAVTAAVAELTIGFMVSLPRQVHIADREIRKGGWSRPVGKRLGESVIGIIGCGRVGQYVLRLLKEFQPKKILINDIIDVSHRVKTILENTNISYQFVSKEEIYSSADVITVHIPLTQLTKKMISLDQLKTFQKTAYLINTARGEIVDEASLYIALKENWIAGAAIDVYEEEPYHGQLTLLENTILTEHIGSCSFDCRLLMELGAAEEAIRFFQGQPLKNEISRISEDI